MRPYIRTLFLFAFFASLLTHTTPAFACDPLGCLLGGYKQDVLALVTISRVDGTVATVRVDHLFPQSIRLPNEPIRIDFANGTPQFPLAPQANEHYLVSVACNDKICTPQWGTWQVDGTDAQTANILHRRNGDDAAIQWFLNGKGKEFYGIDNRMYAKTPEGEYEIYPTYQKVSDTPTTPTQTKEQTTNTALVASIGLVLVGIGIAWKRFAK